MRRSRVDYSGFRLSRLREPRFSHLLLLTSWPIYFLLFVLTENLIPPEACHLVHCALDDIIPFREEFVLVYVFWYLYVAGSLLYYVLYDVSRFRRMQIFILITQAAAMAVYILWPSRQDLRPAVFPRENVCTWLLGLIYTLDTPTGVCPSLHVAYSMGIAWTWWGDRQIPLWFRVLAVAAAVLISLATMFIKQHSAVDVLAALVLCLVTGTVVRRICRGKESP